MAKDAHADIKEMSFEKALSELETIVAKLEQGDVSLEDSIKIYERGGALKQHCETRLKEAKLRVDQIIQNDDGSLATTPFDES